MGDGVNRSLSGAVYILLEGGRGGGGQRQRETSIQIQMHVSLSVDASVNPNNFSFWIITLNEQ